MAPTTDNSRFVFQEGDHALIIDRRGRRYLVRLRSGDTYHTHLGNFAHDSLIGKEEGARITTSTGHELVAVKPTVAEFTLNMPRIATIVYPKDLGAILIHGDIFPGARVLEAGTGSGAMTIGLTRAVGEGGRVFSYDVRSDMIERATANVAAMLPEHSHLSIQLGNVYEGIEEDDLDRVVLDLPEPWRVVPHAARALVPGGIFLSFLPTVLQVYELTQALDDEYAFDPIETLEVLIRPWSIRGRSVRPAQRMVGHTGFITTARKCSPRVRPPDNEPQRDSDSSQDP